MNMRRGMRRACTAIAFTAALLLSASCGEHTVEPCTDSKAKPVLEIAEALNRSTGERIPSLALRNITLNGEPIDTTVLLSNILRNVEHARGGINCTVPCTFGRDQGRYAFDVFSSGFYMSQAETEASYSQVPPGCPMSHGQPTSVALRLIEADSARATFRFHTRTTALEGNAATITFDDGSGPRSTNLGQPQPDYVTWNSGTLHVRVTITAPDTVAVGTIELPLKKDWRWTAIVFLYDHSPLEDSFCIQAKSFPLRRPVPGIDSLYIGWAGAPISVQTAC